MTENEPMSFARNDIMRATEAALKAYDRGVEDGIRQERERIVTALLSDSTLLIAAKEGLGITDIGWAEHMKWYQRDAHKTQVLNYIAAALDHIGLGAVTTEESEHER